MEYPFAMKLKHPIQFGSETISELKFQKPVAKHFRKVKVDMSFNDLLNVGGDMCGQVPSVMDMLDPEDMMEVIGYVGKSLPGGHAVGEKPSE